MPAKRRRRRLNRSVHLARKRGAATQRQPDGTGAEKTGDVTPQPLGVFDAVKAAFDRWRAPEERTLRRSLPVVAATVVLGAICLLGAQWASSSADVVREGGREIARLPGLRFALVVLALSAFEITHHTGEVYLSGVFSRSDAHPGGREPGIARDESSCASDDSGRRSRSFDELEESHSRIPPDTEASHRPGVRLFMVALLVGTASGGFYRLGLIGLVASIFATSVLWVAVPVWCTEAAPLGASLRRSWGLFRRRSWFVVGSAMVVILVRTTAEAVAFGAVAGLLGEVDLPNWTDATVSLLATVVVRLLVVPFGAWLRVVAHSDLAWAEYYESTGRSPGVPRLPEEMGRHLPPGGTVRGE